MKLAKFSMINLSLVFLVVKVAGVDKRKQNEKGHSVCSSYGFSVIEARFSKEVHLLCLKMRPLGSSVLASHRSTLLLDPDREDDQNTINTFSLDDVTMAYGFPVEDPASGSAEGYIGDDHHFYGVLHLRNRTLHADPYGKDDLTKMFGVFENDHMPAPRFRRHYVQPSNPMASNLFEQPYPPYNIEENQRPVKAYARICDLLLLADKEFFEKDANSSLNHVVRRMIHAVAQADIIFRNSDFNEDGLPDNIGFSVKYILVLTSDDTNTRVFGHMPSGKSVDGREYLMKFARLRRLSEVCLGVAFSGHAFHNRTLGLSFTSLGGGMGGAAGGLCDRRAYGRSFNTLAIAHSTTEGNDRVPERIAALTLTHEMGHSFGAYHDDNFPNHECHGYLMGSQSSTGESRKSTEFSLCSKRLIASTLSSMSYCLTDEDRPYCGNGIVEEGEACDCGLPSRCSERDPCCTPRAGGALIFEEGTLHKDGCSVAPTAICHPSQGLCCTANCQYANLLRYGIDCRNQDRECNCTNNTSSCYCGLGGRCLGDGSCHAAECAILGLRECQCLNSPGGALGDFNRCGICCLLDRPEEEGIKCVGAELAAINTIANTLRLPASWPGGDDYSGPNMTVRLCNNAEGVCKTFVLRAWNNGEACVTCGAVGVCSPHAVCRGVEHTARPNVYPNVMHVRLQEKKKLRSSERMQSVNLFLFSVVLLTLLMTGQK